MLKAISRAAAERRCKLTSRRSSLQSTPYESVISEGSFSSYSDDSDSDFGKARRNRRKAVTKRKVAKPLGENKLTREKKIPVRDKAYDEKIIKQSKAKLPRKREEEPSDELVKIAKKEGTTKFHQMRKFLEKANEVDKPADILSGFLASRRMSSPGKRAGSPYSVSRSSIGSSSRSPRANDFHTGLTPSSSQRRMPSPVTYASVNRRDSDEGFAANDLLMNHGESVDNKIGSFIHGQRGLNLRRKMKTVAAGDNIQLALMMEDIPDMQQKLHQYGKSEQRKRIIANTNEGDENAYSTIPSNILDDSQLDEIEAEMMLGL